MVKRGRSITVTTGRIAIQPKAKAVAESWWTTSPRDQFTATADGLFRGKPITPMPENGHTGRLSLTQVDWITF
jgi:hypothetical protein